MKPENVLLDRGDTPWITDFGLATSRSSEASLSNSAGGRGTLHYKAPELWRGKKKGGPLVSPAADVYSFAILSWQLVSGVSPWGGDMDTDIIESVKDGDRPEIDDGKIDWRAQVACPELADLIEECWAQDPEARPSFDDIVRRLDEIARALAAAAAASAAAASSASAAAAKHDEALLERMFHAEAELARARRLTEEYEAALREEAQKRTLAAKDVETLKEDLAGMRVSLDMAEREKQRAEQEKRQLAEAGPPLPDTWRPRNARARPPEAIEIGAGCPEWANVEATFLASLGDGAAADLGGIASIKRIENQHLWELYAAKRHSMLLRAEAEGVSEAQRDAYERNGLFHGTDSDTIAKIVTMVRKHRGARRKE